MTIELTPPASRSETLNQTLTVWLYRVSALVLFAVGIGYWIRLVGVSDGPFDRFDLMPLWWKMAAPALAVLYPVAGIGLWLPASWGAVIWILIALVEAVMHLGFPQLFGSDLVWLGFHVWGLGMLGVLRLMGWREARRARRR